MPRDKLIVHDGIRFLVSGCVNTALTSGVYFLGTIFVSPSIAYTLAWLVGLTFVAVVYPDIVFPGGRRGISDRLFLVALTISVFLVGFALLRFLIERLGDHRIAFIVVLATTMILNFVLTRLALRRP